MRLPESVPDDCYHVITTPVGQVYVTGDHQAAGRYLGSASADSRGIFVVKLVAEVFHCRHDYFVASSYTWGDATRHLQGVTNHNSVLRLVTI